MILANGLNSQAPQFRVLSDAQCQEIFQATLECLNRIGVQVNNAEARDLLASAGARVNGNRVYIPPQIIHDAIESTPRLFTVWGRNGQRAMVVEPNRVHFGPGLTNTFVIDPVTGDKRMPCRGDAGMTARVCDALEHIDYVMGLALLSDVTAELASVYEFAEMIAHTTKPIVAWAHSPENVESIYQIALAVAGGEEQFKQRPNFALFATYPSPLRHTNEDIANLFCAVEHNVPVVYLGGPTVGMESPFTSASALVIHQVAALSGLAMVQLKHRGAAMAIGGVPSAMDLRTARPAYGSPEMSLHSAAAVDLARYLKLPFMGTAGASESKLIDSQAAIESSLQVLMSALSGAAMVHDIGFLDGANIGSLELVVMNDEIIGMVKRMMRGIEVNAETIMLDLIEAVGPGGHFLTEEKSAARSRKEIWVPTLMDRKAYDVWTMDGPTSMEERIKSKLQKILQRHQPTPLSADVTERINAILAEAECQRQVA